jgi:enamine deaminase RidA (YjgF/YER057c/UK114 family)
VLEVDLTAIITEDRSARRRISTTESPKVLGGYAQGVRVGDWVFLAGATPADHTRTSGPFPGGLGTAVAPEARVDSNMWYGSSIERQVEYIMTNKQAGILEAAGSSIDRIVKADVYLSHPQEDLRGFHNAWRSLFGDRAPATTVVPIDGFGSAGSRVEIGIVALATDAGSVVERITVPSVPPPIGPYPHAVRADNLLFVSTLIAADDRGLVDTAKPEAASRNARPQVMDELEYCLNILSEICSASGTSLDNVLRRKSFFTNLSDLFAADAVVRNAWPDAPPASTNVGVAGPHVVPEARVAMDVVVAVA